MSSTPLEISNCLEIAVCAEAFGFGPVSKLASIIRHLSAYRSLSIDVLSESIASEFLIREALSESSNVEINFISIHEAKKRANRYDLALLVLKPDLVEIFLGQTKTVYVDSLGFIWNSDFFENNQMLKKVDIYFAQDLFGAVEKLESNGVRNVVPIGAIMRDCVVEPVERNCLIHAGGALNIYSNSNATEYVDFISWLLEHLVPRKTPLLISETVSIQVNGNSHFTPISQTHQQAIGSFAGAQNIFSSPGLTALLEIAFLKKAIIPLPPQNFSQALIIQNVNREFNGSAPLWKFLANHYNVSGCASEKSGVEFVARQNIKNRHCDCFKEEYCKLAFQMVSDGARLPKNFTPSFSGLDDICTSILDLLKG